MLRMIPCWASVCMMMLAIHPMSPPTMSQMMKFMAYLLLVMVDRVPFLPSSVGPSNEQRSCHREPAGAGSDQECRGACRELRGGPVPLERFLQFTAAGPAVRERCTRPARKSP